MNKVDLNLQNFKIFELAKIQMKDILYWIVMSTGRIISLKVHCQPASKYIK